MRSCNVFLFDDCSEINYFQMSQKAELSLMNGLHLLSITFCSPLSSLLACCVTIFNVVLLPKENHLSCLDEVMTHIFEPLMQLLSSMHVLFPQVCYFKPDARCYVHVGSGRTSALRSVGGCWISC